MIYSLAIGVVSSLDYLDYNDKAKNELEVRDFDDGLGLLDNWRRWVNFTYALIAINILIIIIFIFYETDQSWNKGEIILGGSAGSAGSSWFTMGAIKPEKSSSTSFKHSKKLK